MGLPGAFAFGRKDELPVVFFCSRPSVFPNANALVSHIVCGLRLPSRLMRSTAECRLAHCTYFPFPSFTCTLFCFKCAARDLWSRAPHAAFIGRAAFRSFMAVIFTSECLPATLMFITTGESDSLSRWAERCACAKCVAFSDRWSLVELSQHCTRSNAQPRPRTRLGKRLTRTEAPR